MLKIAVLGSGRMGRQVVQVVNDAEDCTLAGVWSRRKVDIGGTATDTDLRAVLQDADVAIDFTLPSASAEIVKETRASATPLVCGVSGLNEPQLQELKGLAEVIPVLYARNMSIGVAVLRALVQLAGRSLEPRFATEIQETHHIHKIDAPSGTALMLGEALAGSRSQRFSEVYHYRPEDSSDAMPANAINFVVKREGDVPGDHSVTFSTDSENICLSHSVTDRRVFAEGAVQAAIWTSAQSPGSYGITDILAKPA